MVGDDDDGWREEEGGSLSWAPNPRDEPDERREEMMRSNPTNAPAKTKRMFVVSMVYCSLFPAGLPPSRPPLSGLSPPLPSDFELLSCLAFTVTVVPSIIFKSPCWTPSPETSRPWVIMAGLASLSTSSKKIIPDSHFEMEWLEARRRRSMEDSMSVPM